MATLSQLQEARARENLSSLLKALCMAVVGLKVVPAEMRCYRPEEIEALQVLARRSDVQRADALDWEDAV